MTDDITTYPRVAGSPETIWLNYGDLERDDTHANCVRNGEVTWCEDSVFVSDVKYVRADRIRNQVLEEAAKKCEPTIWADVIRAMKEAE